MKQANLFRILLISLITICLSACSDNKDEIKEIYPIRFDDTSYEVRMGVSESIGFVDGSGDYTLKVENPQLLEASISIKTKTLIISAKQKGETVLSITDNGVGETVNLKIKVTDSYIGFINADGNIPMFPIRTNLFLVNNASKEFYLFNQANGSNGPADEPILKGNYEIAVENKISYLTLVFQNKEKGTETHKFNIQKSDSQVYAIMSKYLNIDWETMSESVRSTGPQTYFLHMNEESTGLEAYWTISIMQMPKDILK